MGRPENTSSKITQEADFYEQMKPLAIKARFASGSS